VVSVQIGYVYDSVYLSDSEAIDVVNQNRSFGHFTFFGAPATTTPNHRQITLYYNWDGLLGHPPSGADGLGSWTLSPHHVLSPATNTLYLGDGSVRAPDVLPNVTKSVGALPSDEADVVAVSPDGGIYFAVGCALWRMDPSGTAARVAGIEHTCNGAPGYAGEGGPALQATLGTISAISFDNQGAIYISDFSNESIYRIDSAGTIRTYAGGGTAALQSNGVPASTIAIRAYCLAASPDGGLYVGELDSDSRYRVLNISTDGNVRTVVRDDGLSHTAAPSDGSTLSNAYLLPPIAPKLACALGADGSLYLNDAFAIRRVAPDGTFWTFGGSQEASVDISQPPADGIPASKAVMVPETLAVAPDGSVVYWDSLFQLLRVVRNGFVTTIAGHGQAGPSPGEGALATQVSFDGSTFGVAADGTIVVGNTFTDKLWRVQSAAAGGSAVGLAIASEDGAALYQFDGSGRHLRTLNALTGAALYTFGYDPAGRLASVTDVDGNQTNIQRDASGIPTAITNPFGQAMALSVDSSGYLASIRDAVGSLHAYTYASSGLLQSTTTPLGEVYTYSYDSDGRLLSDVDASGGGASMTNAVTVTGNVVTRTTAGGVTSTYELDSLPSGAVQQSRKGPDGLFTKTVRGIDGVIARSMPDGTVTSTTTSPDSRFGMQAPLATAVTISTPSGLTMTGGVTRAVTLADQSNLVSVQTATTTSTINGKTWTRTFDAASRTWTSTSPAGRQSTITVDLAERPAQVSVSGIAPITYSYDAHGRPTAITQGSRTWTLTYDAQGYLESRTDPLGQVTSYTNDSVGRPTQTALADGRLVGMAYDNDGNPTSVALPNTESHAFSYTPVDLLASYTPPSLSSASPATQYTYDVDRRLTSVTRPDGVAVAYAYDAAGRLQTTTIPQGALTRTYGAANGLLSSIVAPGGEGVSYTYDGFLRTGSSWSGAVAGSVTLGFDNNFRVTSQVVNTASLAFGYDADGLLQTAGTLALTRDPSNGHLSGTTLGGATDAYTYDTNGLLSTYVAKSSGSTIYSETIVRDAVGRITEKTETIGGTTHVWGYTYDASGRVTDVTEDGSSATHYGYDADDNRTTFTNASGSVNPTYDAQDRLLSYGSANYNYTANGELTGKTDSTGTTSYTYDPFGNLLNVALPNGTAIDYVVDGQNRRVGKKVNGTLTQGFLYQNALKPVAQLDGSGNVVSRFVYGSRGNVPDYFTKGTSTYRILSDHLGSPRLIVSTSTGSIVEEIDYDEFGNVTNDTQPGFQPFGFAGGLYDQDTKLLRFGARDYDPVVGRWTAKDPIGLNGGLGVYVYAWNDPQNAIDPSGLVVQGTYDQGSGMLTLRDVDTGQVVSIPAESGGKPWGDPIPNGNYEIVERNGKAGFYRLDSLDANPGDDIDQRTGRSHFRLHKPGNTIGCIAAESADDWNQVSELIQNTQTGQVIDHSTPWWDPFSWFHGGQPLTFYGTLAVIGSK
jgi:RHS repeat-associated protein